MILSILGCGWLGNAIKETFEAKDNTVYCLTHDIGMNHFCQMYDCSVFIFAIPPTSKDYLEVIEETIYCFDKEKMPFIIFISSISYYDNNPLVVEAEKLLKDTLATHTLDTKMVILRLGGLMGYDRIAGKYSAGKILEGNSSTNYVHRDDVIGIIENLISQRLTAGVYDVVAPIQSTKKEIFTQNARKFGFKKTTFKDVTLSSKTLSPKRISDKLSYSFKKPDVKEFWD